VERCRHRQHRDGTCFACCFPFPRLACWPLDRIGSLDGWPFLVFFLAVFCFCFCFCFSCFISAAASHRPRATRQNADVHVSALDSERKRQKQPAGYLRDRGRRAGGRTDGRTDRRTDGPAAANTLARSPAHETTRRLPWAGLLPLRTLGPREQRTRRRADGPRTKTGTVSPRTAWPAEQTEWPGSPTEGGAHRVSRSARTHAQLEPEPAVVECYSSQPPRPGLAGSGRPAGHRPSTIHHPSAHPHCCIRPAATPSTRPSLACVAAAAAAVWMRDAVRRRAWAARAARAARAASEPARCRCCL